jgi:hypothetical protein
MRTKYFILNVLPVLTLLIASCDHIADPNEKYAPAAAGTNFITKTNGSVSSIKKVLLEDYTGQTCQNCPPAATTAETLSLKYEDSLIVLAVHAGGFAAPNGTLYPNDYRTPAGDTWAGTAGFSIISYPSGMVNRMDFPTNSHPKAYTTWGNYIPGKIHIPQEIKLDVTTKYDTSARALNVDVKIKYKKTFTANDVKLSVVLSEDSIIGNQKSGSSVIANYVFMHMMRGALNGDWGDVLNTSAVAANDSTSKSYPNFAVNPSFKDKHLAVVVFAYSAATKEIIQAEKVKIR